MDDRKIAEQAVREAIRGYYGDGAFVARLLNVADYAFKCMEVMDMFYSALKKTIMDKAETQKVRHGKCED